ncbi:MAG: hypothetical protein ACLSGK_02355 [Lachnospiraceae bacterium]
MLQLKVQPTETAFNKYDSHLENISDVGDANTDEYVGAWIRSRAMTQEMMEHLPDNQDSIQMLRLP